MPDLTPDHPAVEAAHDASRAWLADLRDELPDDLMVYVLTAALPHLTADDLRDTPAGRELMAEAKREVACGLECLAARYDLSGHGEAALGARAAAEALLVAFPKEGTR